MYKILFSYLLLLMTTNTHAQTNDVQVKNYNTNNKLAIDGYDPVAYFLQHKAVKGNKNFAVNVNGIIYYCSSQSNKDLFLKTPSAYEPQYGGWCAYAMGAKGEKVEVDPETFKITNGKLYLFYNKYLTNTLTSWNKDEAALKIKADENWKQIISK
ncbi:MAG: YHS domain-containing (seleno)protein [Chitinophagales bacterium]